MTSKKSVGILCILESKGKIEKMHKILKEIYKQNVKVISTGGHLIDLPSNKMGIDVNNGFDFEYEVIDRQKKFVNMLKSDASSYSQILIASDKDREGEMIAWSIAKACNLDLKEKNRLIFNSVTKSQILAGIKNITRINLDLVYAQKARRGLDRILGYSISPLLPHMINNTSEKAFSAGRVQSVVVKLIVEREEEIENFFNKDSSSHYSTVGTFYDLKETPFDARLLKNKSPPNIFKHNNALSTIEILSKSKYKLLKIEKKKSQSSPSPPYTTSTLQQDAAKRYGFSVQETMDIAKNLYDTGLITYIRTDSINLSPEALIEIGNFIEENYGEKYHNEHNYESKSGNTQEAHEAIRPTDVNIIELEDNDKKHKNLYNMIWRRAIASQMSNAIYSLDSITIEILDLENYYFHTNIKKLEFDGFLKVFKPTKKEDDEDNINNLELKEDEYIDIINIKMTQEYERPPKRYNEASLVNILDPKNLNIGRPSTYQTLIAKILTRYVTVHDIEGIKKKQNIITWKSKVGIEEFEKTIIIGGEKKKMIPTKIGVAVVKALEQYFPELMSYEFTAEMENKLDDIAENKIKWVKVLNDFYKKFNPIIQSLMASKFVLDDNKLFGVLDDESKVYVLDGKFGKYAKIISPDGIQSNISLKDVNKITLDTIKNKIPIRLGEFNGLSIVVKTGIYGKYIEYGNKNITIPADSNLTLEEAKKLIQAESEKFLFDQKEGKFRYTVRNGKYGKYISKIKDGKSQNFPVPASVPIDSITLGMIKDIISDYQKKNKK